MNTVNNNTLRSNVLFFNAQINMIDALINLCSKEITALCTMFENNPFEVPSAPMAVEAMASKAIKAYENSRRLLEVRMQDLKVEYGIEDMEVGASAPMDMETMVSHDREWEAALRADFSALYVEEEDGDMQEAWYAAREQMCGEWE